MARYHPIYEGLWDDGKLEGLSFECHGFFAFLCSNKRCRPSGIYRATDGQLAEDSGLSVGKVHTYLDALATRSRIVRDGAWLFVRGYLDRQPKHERLMKQVAGDLSECTSEAIGLAFFQRYPLLLQPMRALVGNLPAYTSSSPSSSASPSASHTPPPPFQEKGGSLPFEKFWMAYPSKTGRGIAEEAWGKLIAGKGRHQGKPRPSMDEILAAIEKQRAGRKWREGIIPNPATWVNQRRWHDEVDASPVLTPKTQGNVEALRRFTARGQKESQS
ncbi:MAG: hypothetical protein HY323_09330 [Betaproteobacteria bacterium]|nr:hypothetical protein [Betaproteobacteria bacterium]